jgi:hypothetical protein
MWLTLYSASEALICNILPLTYSWSHEIISSFHFQEL